MAAALRPGHAGAELHPSVARLRIDRVQDVGVKPDDEGYSGFEGNDLAEYLRGTGVRRVLVTGIATDYCVRATALDAVREGFDTTVFTDAMAAIDVAAGDGRRALDEVRAAGGSLDRVALLRDEAALEPILDAKAVALREVAHAAGRGRLDHRALGRDRLGRRARDRRPGRRRRATSPPSACRRGTPSRCIWTTPRRRRPPSASPTRTC